MRIIAVLAAVLCSFSSASALTPFNLDLTRIASCKVKYDYKGEATLLVSFIAYDKDGKYVTEFGDENGQPIENPERSREINTYLLSSGICPVIKRF